MKHLKPKSGVWLHFTEVTAEGGSKKAQCNLCSSGPGKSPWLTVPNATRLAKHLSGKHRTKPEEDSAQHNPSSSSSTTSSPAELNEVRTPPRAEGGPCSQVSGGLTPSKKQKHGKVSDYLDRPFTNAEQLATERAQALALVLKAQSCNSQEQPWPRADWAASNRERIGFEKLSREVKLRFNYLRLQEGTVTQ